MVDYTDAMGNMNGAQAPAPEPETPAAPQAPSQAQARAVDNKLSAGQRVDLRQSEQDPRRVDRPAAPKGNASRPGYDPDIEKAQGYMRMFGITEVDVSGQKKELGVDGVNGPVTSAALAKYKADNGLGNEDDFASVLRHMEERAKKNAPDLQERMRQTAAQGPLANPNNVMGMQLILNLLAPIISALTGGKINLQQLKIDGVNGTQTTNAFNGYQAAPAVTPKPDAKPAAAPAAPSTGSGAATPTTTAPAAAPARPAAPAVAAPAQPAAPAAPQVDTVREQALKTELGMNDEEWTTLKKAQLEWEDRANKGQEVSKISPLAREQLKLAQAHEPALEAGQKPRSDEVIMKEKGIDPLAALGPRGKIYAEQGPNGGVVFVKPPEPAAPAVATPKAPAAPAQPAVATVVPNKDPNASLADRAAYRQQQVDGYMQTRGLTEQQANFQVTRDRYQELKAMGVSRGDVSGMVSDERRAAAVMQNGNPQYQRGPYMPQADAAPMAVAYNVTSGLDDVRRMMAARAELRSQGWNDKNAKDEVNRLRGEELRSQGADDKTIKQIVRNESASADGQERTMRADDRAYANAQRAADNRMAADQRRSINDYSRGADQMVRVLGDKNPRNDSQAYGVGAGLLVRTVLNGGIPGFGGGSDGGSPRTVAQDRAAINQTASDANRMTRILSDGNTRNDSQAYGTAAGVLVRGAMGGIPGISNLISGGGRVETRTYPQQSERPGYVAQARLDQGDFSLERGQQITPRMAGAADDGVTEQQRAQIIANYEAQKAAAPATAQPTASSIRQYQQDIHSP